MHSIRDHIEMPEVPMGEIEIGSYSPPSAIGTLRSTWASQPDQPLSIERLREKGAIAAGAIAINVALLVLLIDGLQMWNALSRRSRFDQDEHTIQAFLADSNTLPASDDNVEVRTPVLLSPRDGVLRKIAPPDFPTPVIRSSKSLPAAAGENNNIPTQTDRERLSGIYRVQIAARIARTLENAGLAHHSCVVHLVQRTDGVIGEMTIERCTGDESSQRRVMSAIQQATPLPAPPRADIFEPAIVVHVGSNIWVRGAAKLAAAGPELSNQDTAQ